MRFTTSLYSILICFFIGSTFGMDLTQCSDLFSASFRLDQDHKLLNDINCVGYPSTFTEANVIQSYSSNFNGNNKKIIGLNMQITASTPTSDGYGMIASMNAGSLKDLTFENCTLTSTANGVNLYRVALFVGYARNNLGNILISNCHSIRNNLSLSGFNTVINSFASILGYGEAKNGYYLTIYDLSVKYTTITLTQLSKTMVCGSIGGQIGHLSISNGIISATNFLTKKSTIISDATGLLFDVGLNVGTASLNSASTFSNLTSITNVVDVPGWDEVAGNVGLLNTVPTNLVSSSNSIKGKSYIGGNVGYFHLDFALSPTPDSNYVSCGNNITSTIKPGGIVGLVIYNSAPLNLKNVLSYGNNFVGNGDNYIGNVIGSWSGSLSNCNTSSNTGISSTFSCTGSAPSTLSCPITIETCSSTSCGSSGLCTPSGLCKCASNTYPSIDLLSCDVSPTCPTPANYSTNSTTIPPSVYNSRLTSEFSQGKWKISVEFNQAQSTMRNVQIVSSSGQVCKDFTSDLSSAASASSLLWSQSVNSTNPNNCKDIVSGAFSWTDISSCLRSAANQNRYSGMVVSTTTVSNTDFNQTNFGKRDLGTTQFTVGRNFSMDFQSTIQINSSQVTFVFSNGTSILINLNVTSSPNNVSCFIDLLATAFNISPNLVLISNWIDPSFTGTTTLNVTILDDFVVGNDSVAITQTINQMINNGTLSCGNITAFNLTSVIDSKKAFVKLLSSVFDSATLKLTLNYQVRISTPLIVTSQNAFFTSNSLTSLLTVGSATCDADYCTQNVQLVYDLSTKDCNGVTENSVLNLPPSCQSGDTSCVNVLGLFDGKNVSFPVAFSLEWCPLEQKTQLSPVSFDLFSNGSKISNGQVITSNNTLVGRITVHVDLMVAGSSLFNSNVTSLSLSDGLSQSSLNLNTISQRFDSSAFPNITVEFVHVFSPSSINLNFSRSLFYVADVNVLFGVPASKRRAVSFVQESYPIHSVSNSFVIQEAVIQSGAPPSSFPSPSSPSPSKTPSKSGSSSTVGIAVGVSVGGCAILMVVLIVVLLIRRRSNNSSSILKEDIEFQFQKNSKF